MTGGSGASRSPTRWRERALTYYYEVQLETRRRRDGLDTQIEQIASDPLFSDTVARLRAIRGISTLTALALCVSDRRLAQVQWRDDRSVSRAGAERILKR